MNTGITQSSVTQSSIKQTINGAACSLSKRNSRAIYLLAVLVISVAASMPYTAFATQLATDNQPAQVLMDEQARLEAKADASRDLSNKTELEQLEKARQASQQSEQRVQDILSKQEKRDWQAEQQDKAEQDFEQRQSREQRYLEEAKKAAGQEKKLIIKQQTIAAEEQ
jgi:hypothetical protein